jgi:hypothetical protein
MEKFGHIAAVILSIAMPAAAQQARDTCYECHLGLTGKLQRPARLWVNDVHRRQGLACTACHNGDATVADLAGSKGPNFVGSWEREDVAKLCGRCHANQTAEYHSSVHGARLAAGNAEVANCIDCHAIHEIQVGAGAGTQTAPARAAQTCTLCHSEVAELLKGGSHEAMLAGGDGACIGCHGSHKAAEASAQLLTGPGPGCAQCHAAGTADARQAAEMARLTKDLKDALERSDRMLAQAAAKGDALSGAQADQKAGREALQKARAAVHSFRAPDVALQVKNGLASADKAYRAAESALQRK